jgi:hypothetical protein
MADERDLPYPLYEPAYSLAQRAWYRDDPQAQPRRRAAELSIGTLALGWRRLPLLAPMLAAVNVVGFLKLRLEILDQSCVAGRSTVSRIGRRVSRAAQDLSASSRLRTSPSLDALSHSSSCRPLASRESIFGDLQICCASWAIGRLPELSATQVA